MDDPVYIDSDDEDFNGSYISDEEAKSDVDIATDNDPVEKEQNYSILTENDIKQRQEKCISEIRSILVVSNEAACLLLLHHKWNVNNVYEEWFANEVKVREAVGILEGLDKKPKNSKSKIDCGICFDECLSENSRCTVYCDHLFCYSCWKCYVSSAINDGAGCLTLKCPYHKCGAAVGLDMVDDDNLALSEVEKAKYHRYLLGSYVENSPNIKWCPAPSCKFAVEYVLGSGNYDVVCRCLNRFCWSCLEEVHSPVDCETVASWVLKNYSEAENTKWIMKHSKPCPKCKRPIEKNNGCMHMTCRAPCTFEFCWFCLLDWKSHNKRSVTSCNVYLEAKAKGGVGSELNEAEQQKKMANKSLDIYAHYYERWASNNKSRIKALDDLHKMQEHLERLGDIQRQSPMELEFITEAWQQIAECRRVLKWTYAYGFYSIEKELEKKEFFEHLQGQAEQALEKLHLCAEEELKSYINPNPEDPPAPEFNTFRNKLTGLTRATRKYFENLVRALENGLSDVTKTKKHSISKNKAGTSKGMTRNLPGWECDFCTHWNEQPRRVCTACRKTCTKKAKGV